jgi:peptide/nickel transport system substrate-binding protein
MQRRGPGCGESRYPPDAPVTGGTWPARYDSFCRMRRRNGDRPLSLDVLRTGRGPVAEHVIDEFVAGRLSRREFLCRGTMVGLSVPLLGGILTACGSSAPSSPGSTAKGKGGATIKVGIGVPTAAINPITIADQGGLEIIGEVGEWLAFSDQHNNYHPWLATSWSPNADAASTSPSC